MTLLDDAHAAMETAPDDEAARLAFYSRIAEVELVLLLEQEADGASVEPKVFPLESGPAVIAFDTDERLAEFAGAVPYLALPGRRLAEMLAGQGLALGINLGVAPSAILIPSEGITWLAEMVGADPAEAEARIVEVAPPHGLPEAFVTAIDGKLARAAGLASGAYLASASYDTGAKGHILAFIDAVEGAQGPLATEISEALRFSGLEAAALDVIFVRASDLIAARLAKVGLRFDLPEPEPLQSSAAAAPGSDPERPPKLR